MSDMTTCPNCSAELPAGAAFCTTCGHRMEASAAAAPAEDATRVDNPALGDATQTWASAPAAPWSPPDQPQAPPAPWQPADSPGTAQTPPPQSPPPAAPPAAPPWNQAPGQPSGQGAPPWQQAQAPAGASTWGATPAAAPARGSSSDGSPIGGVVALLGAILTLIGLFTAWVGSNQSSENITGWDLASGDKGLESNDPYILLALGIAALVIGVMLFTGTARMLVRGAAIVAGLAMSPSQYGIG